MRRGRRGQERTNRRRTGTLTLVSRDLIKHRYIYLMILPAVVFYFVFHYIPLYGAQIAFRNSAFKGTVQSISYLPHFISLVVVCGMIVDFLSRGGVINHVRAAFGAEPVPFMIKPEWFRAIYVSSGIWQEMGWGSIIYLAALAGIDPQLYEAAAIDGAGRFRRMFGITIPSILPTVVIMLILRMGTLFSLGAEKILLLYNSNTCETADVIATYVYRKGLLQMSYSAAVGLFDSAIKFALLLLVNRVSRKVTETSLWQASDERRDEKVRR